ncbi:MAG: hypothetical protein JWO59_2638 [Chloroflexi bacterium]|nr:hypothetical protein [Chloroflexota bacterium]
MITSLNGTLKELLLKRIPLDTDEVDISFDCPTRDWSGKVIKPTVDLYLYDLRENLDLRRTAWKTERGENGHTGQRRPLVYIDLAYFITAWAREVADEHLLLWRVMVALMREPVIGSDVLQGQLRDVEGPVRTSTAQSDGVLRNPGEFWTALNNDLKPAVIYSATVEVDLDVWREAPLVLTSIANLGGRDDRRQRQYIAIGGVLRERPPAAKGKANDALPASGAQVSLPALGINVRSDEDGRFVVPNVPVGTHRVQVTTAGGSVSERDLVVPARSYDLEV